jgi:hypothetical protein
MSGSAPDQGGIAVAARREGRIGPRTALGAAISIGCPGAQLLGLVSRGKAHVQGAVVQLNAFGAQRI